MTAHFSSLLFFFFYPSGLCLFFSLYFFLTVAVTTFQVVLFLSTVDLSSSIYSLLSS